MIAVPEITAASTIIIINWVFLMQISSAQYEYKVSNITNETVRVYTIPTSGDEVGEFDYSHPYLEITISGYTCDNVNATISDFQNCTRIVQEDLSRIKAKSSLTTKDNNNIELFGSSLKILQKLELELKEICWEKPFQNPDHVSTIVKLLKMRAFSIAYKTLQFYNSSKRFDEIEKNYFYKNFVQEMYEFERYGTSEAARSSGFFKLLAFGNSISDIDLKFKLYDTMYRVMSFERSANIFRVLELHHSVMTEIVKVPGINGTNGTELICKLWADNREKAITLLSAILLNDDRWPTAQETKNDIRTFCLGFLYNVTGDVIGKVYKNTDFSRLMEKIRRNVDDIKERIIICESIINKLEIDNKLNDDLIWPMVRYMKMTWNDLKLNDLCDCWRKRYERTIKKLHSSLQNVICVSSVCIKNSHYGEYLYAEDSEHSYWTNSSRKYYEVSTRMPHDGYKLAKFIWKLGFDPDHEHFIALENEKYDGNLNVHLPSCTDTACTCILESNLPKRRSWNWRFRLNGSGVQLDLSELSYFLFVDERKRDINGRFVFAIQSQPRPTDKPEYRMTWEFTDCSDIRRFNYSI
ncbi:hypothetical protein U1Q18_049695 [Sarracenia purpurea var. burkii]